MATLQHFEVINQIELGHENTVVFVGTALDGPANTPFSLHAEADPYEALGMSPLAHAYNAARKAGTNRIVAYRINGVHAKTGIRGRSGEEVVQLTSLSASEKYNEIKVWNHPDHLSIIGTDGRTRNYFYDRYPTANDLNYAINQDAFYGLLEVQSEALIPQAGLKDMVDGRTELLMRSGQSEGHLINHRNPEGELRTNPAVLVPELKERLELALFGEDPSDVLERQPNGPLGLLNYGVLSVCDMFHDDDGELSEILGSFAMNKTKDTEMGCVVVLGTAPLYLKSNMPKELQVQSVKKQREDLVTLAKSHPDKECYKYVEVVTGHTQYLESNKEMIPLSYSYAATKSLLDYHTINTNKQILGIGNLSHVFTKEDIALLSSNGYTCIVPSIRRGFVSYHSTSYLRDQSAPSSKPHCVRIGQFVSKMISEQADMLIGERYTPLTLKEIDVHIVERMDELVTRGVLKSYSLSYELYDYNRMLNITASLTPFSEVRSVSSIATLGFAEGVVE